MLFNPGNHGIRTLWKNYSCRYILMLFSHCCYLECLLNNYVFVTHTCEPVPGTNTLPNHMCKVYAENTWGKRQIFVLHLLLFDQCLMLLTLMHNESYTDSIVP